MVVNLTFRINSWATLALVSVLASQVRAENTDDPERVAARTLGYAGIEAYEAGDFQTAGQQLDKAYSVLRVPSLGLWSARALRKQGRLVEAAARLREVKSLELGAVEVDVQQRAQQDAAADLQELEASIPRVVIQVIGTGESEAEVELDGRPLPTPKLGQSLELDPGVHLIEARFASQRLEKRLSVGEGEQQLVVLEFSTPPPEQVPIVVPPAAPESPPEQQPVVDHAAMDDTRAQPTGDEQPGDFVSDTLPWVLIGVGGAGVVVGSVSLGMALDTRGEIESNPDCRDLRCRPTESSIVDRYNTLGTVSGVGLIAGGVIAASGVTLLLLDQDGTGEAAALRVGPTALWVSGEF